MGGVEILGAGVVGPNGLCYAHKHLPGVQFDAQLPGGGWC